MKQELDPGHTTRRNGLAGVGIILIAIGGIFALVGLIDFFSAFGGMEPPRKFWCLFVGAPLIAVGMTLLKFAMLGTISRYVAGEVAPVGKDVVNYMGRETGEGVEAIAAAVTRGIRQNDNATPAVVAAEIECSGCGATNDNDATYCKACGAILHTQFACSQCGNLNDADARFCDRCGAQLGPATRI